jgi:hypothetical protein
VVLHSGRIVAIGAYDEEHARAIYGIEQDIRDVEPYDPTRHLHGRDLAEWKRLTGYVDPIEPDPAPPEARNWSDAMADPAFVSALHEGLSDVEAGRVTPMTADEIERRLEGSPEHAG